MIWGNNPSLEFYLNSYTKEISEDGIEKIRSKRSSFKDVLRKINNRSLITYTSADVFEVGEACTSLTIADLVFTNDVLKKYWNRRLNTDGAESYYKFGLTLQIAGNNNGAISYYKKAIKLNPDLSKLHNNLGVSMLKKGELNNTVNYFKEAIRLQPNYQPARNNLKIAIGNLEKK